VPSPFHLDPKIEADSVPVADLPLCQLRLMNDARYPWLLLVPQRTETEIFELAPPDQAMLLDEIAQASAALKAVTACRKLNIASLGNVVRQLHIHVIARFNEDASWPRPVWGVGEAVAYEPARRDRLIGEIRAALPT
jgi:diadenosine tetraphosphate (Ap4A) HIT family hydrolase